MTNQFFFSFFFFFFISVNLVGFYLQGINSKFPILFHLEDYIIVVWFRIDGVSSLLRPLLRLL